MDILRTSLQQQSDQMLQELEARMSRTHTNAINALNNKHQEEIRILNDNVSVLEREILKLADLNSSLTKRHADIEKVSAKSLLSRYILKKRNC
jgi:hypothetical protein